MVPTLPPSLPPSLLVHVAHTGVEAADAVAAEVELSEGGDGGQRQGERSQLVIGQVQTPQPREPKTHTHMISE